MSVTSTLNLMCKSRCSVLTILIVINIMCCVLLPLYSVQLVSVFPGHQQTSSPSTLQRTQHTYCSDDSSSNGNGNYTGLRGGCYLQPLLSVLLIIKHILLRPHEATCYTFHRCLQFHWWDRRLRRRWYRRWRSQTSEHAPANKKRWGGKWDTGYNSGLNSSCYVLSLPANVDMKEMGWSTFLR